MDKGVRMNIMLERVYCKNCGWVGASQDLRPKSFYTFNDDDSSESCCPNCWEEHYWRWVEDES